MKKLLVLSACLWALGSPPVVAQAAPPAIAVVRVEDYNGMRLVIIRGEGQREEIKLPAGASFKKLGDSGEGLQRVITKLYQEGYSLKSTFEGARGSRATLIFEKRLN